MDRNLLSHISGNPDLKELKSLRSFSSPGFKAHRDFQKKKAASPGEEDQKAWFNNMKIVFREIDEYCNFSLVSPKRPCRFLDLGCCPGGFSSYILQQYPLSSGFGISLPVEDGGHRLLLEEVLKSQFTLFWANLTRYELSRLPTRLLHQKDFRPFPFNNNDLVGSFGFDLIIADGHPLRHTTDGEVAHFINWRPPHCLSASIALKCAAQSLSAGSPSTIVIKLSKPDRTISTQIMYLLDILSTWVCAMKPVFVHATRSTFYFVASEVGCGTHGQMLPVFIDGLCSLWRELIVENDGRGRQLQLEIQDIYLERLNELAAPVWKVERASLEGWYQNEKFAP
ncbi:hypothetical protein DL96DRAFT_1600554 [Flagelloscypha sp. PMI_526]|nr:hypothetical protein DL96DRAFT_1600554 [Flagelloscypha sp. PMI_526]